MGVEREKKLRVIVQIEEGAMTREEKLPKVMMVMLLLLLLRLLISNARVNILQGVKEGQPVLTAQAVLVKPPAETNKGFRKSRKGKIGVGGKLARWRERK